MTDALQQHPNARNIRLLVLDVDVEKLRQGFTRYAPLGGLIALVVVVQIGIVVWVRGLGLEEMPLPAPKPAGHSNTAELGQLLYTQYLYPFEVAAVILLVPVGLVMKQPDLGTSLLILAAGLYVIFFAGLSWKLILPVLVVAAITLTMRRRPGQKLQDVGKQVAVRARDRVRIVKMDAEGRQ